jgi:predicted metal-binding membrane protein
MLLRGQALTAAGLAAVSVAAWIVVIVMGDDMPMGAALWLLAWTTMMAAMMLPSAAPLFLLYENQGGPFGSGLLAAGYLLLWAAVGIAAFEIDMHVPDPGTAVVALVLIGAGVYQFTPLKNACLGRCRAPTDFLVTHWHPGRAGAVRIGVEHGLYCVGCCWALMAVLVVVGAMALAWVAVIALAVAAEKLLPQGAALARVVGVALVTSGILIAT